MVKVGEVWRWKNQWVVDWEIVELCSDGIVRCKLVKSTNPNSIALGFLRKLEMDVSDIRWTKIPSHQLVEEEYV